MHRSDKWKHFERLVAAIHQAADSGSDVRWDEIIEGRQFDVTIRFRKGLHEYLTVVECKDYANAVPVHEVEAFVTKSKDIHAHQAVIASSSGFQSGAQEVARRHGVTLIQLEDSDDVDPSIFGAWWEGTTPAVHIVSIELEYRDGEKKCLPEQSNVMTYYAQQIRIQSDAQEQSLEDVIESQISRFLNEKAEDYQDFVIPCEPDARVIGPDDGEIPLKALARIHIRLGLNEARILNGRRMFDVNLLAPDVTVRNVLTGEKRTFGRNTLRLGFNTTFTAGEFYEQPPLPTYFYVDEIKDNVARLYVVESFQNGILFQAEILVETRYANHYIPVSDEVTIQRLRRRLERLKASQNRRNVTNRSRV